MTDLKNLYQEELKTLLTELGEPKFRASQIFSWIHRKNAVSFEQMTNLPLSLRERLTEQFSLTCVSAEEHLKSMLDGTEKFLFLLLH